MKDITFIQIVFVDVIYNLMTHLAEASMGYGGHCLGQHSSLITDTVIIDMTLTSIGFADSFLPLANFNSFWSIGSHLRTGDEDSCLYETLPDDFAECMFLHVYGAVIL